MQISSSSSREGESLLLGGTPPAGGPLSSSQRAAAYGSSINDGDSIVSVTKGSKEQKPPMSPLMSFPRRGRAFSALPPDIEESLDANLMRVNPYRQLQTRRLGAKDSQVFSEVFVWEYTSAGSSELKEMTLRDLLQYVNALAKRIDDGGGQVQGTSTTSPGNMSSSKSTSDLAMMKDMTAATHLLRLRDLRRLEVTPPQIEVSGSIIGSSTSPRGSCAVLVRRHSVLFSIDTVRAIVMHDRLLFLVPDGADSVLQVLERFMQSWKPSARRNANAENLPFEMHAFDALLTLTQTVQAAEVKSSESLVREILADFDSRGTLLPIKEQEVMRGLKNSVTQTRTWFGNLQATLDIVVQDDEAMALMNLTLLAERPGLYTYPLNEEILAKHEDIEELIESYIMDFSSLSSKLDNNITLLNQYEDFVSLRLNFSRNEILVVDLIFTLVTMFIGLGSFVTGIFGMNLDTMNLEVVAAVCGASIVLFSAAVVVYLRAHKILPTRDKVVSVIGADNV